MDQTTDVGVALGLGVVQGTTEFLPVSSSGHLGVYALFADVPEMSLAWVLLLHASTLLATVVCFRRELAQLLRSSVAGLSAPRAFLGSEDGRVVTNVVIASVPTAVIGLLLESRVEALGRMPAVLGVGFLASAAMALWTRRGGGGAQTLSLGAALLVGAAQGAAVMPGLSRSGTTIAVAMALGLTPIAAFRFSFLLSMPVIAGATVLKLGSPDVLAGLSSTVWLAAVITFVTGYASLRLLGSLVSQGRFWVFACYLVPLGGGLLLHQALGGAG